MKIKNNEIFNLFVKSFSNVPKEEKGIFKLMNSNKINIVHSYKLSLIYKKLETQYNVIEQHRVKINMNNTKKGVANVEKIIEEFKLIQDEEFEIGEKIDLKLEDIKNVGLSPYELSLLSCIINYI